MSTYTIIAREDRPGFKVELRNHGEGTFQIQIESYWESGPFTWVSGYFTCDSTETAKSRFNQTVENCEKIYKGVERHFAKEWPNVKITRM